MSKAPALRLTQRVGLRPLLAARLLLALPFALHGQTQVGTVGYGSVRATDATPTGYSFVNGMSSSTLFVVPFAINYPEGENYTVNAVNLLLRDGTTPLHVDGSGPDVGSEPVSSGDPSASGTPSGVTGATYSGVSLNIFSTLPTSLSLPTSLLDFSSAPGTGPVVNKTVPWNFPANSTPIFSAGVTYYLAFTYSGPGNLEWSKVTNDSYGYDFPGDIPVTSLVADGTPLVYYKVTADGVQGFYDNIGGFSIMANAISAIPEPATAGALAASSVLALALFVRWRRRRTMLVREPDSIVPPC